MTLDKGIYGMNTGGVGERERERQRTSKAVILIFRRRPHKAEQPSGRVQTFPAKHQNLPKACLRVNLRSLPSAYPIWIAPKTFCGGRGSRNYLSGSIDTPLCEGVGSR